MSKNAQNLTHLLVALSVAIVPFTCLSAQAEITQQAADELPGNPPELAVPGRTQALPPGAQLPQLKNNEQKLKELKPPSSTIPAGAVSPDIVSPELTGKPEYNSQPSQQLNPIFLPGYQPKPMTHDEAKVLNLNQLYLSRTIELSSFKDLRNETSVDQEITLREAINYVLDQGMPIKVSRESMNYQHYLTLSGIASFAPTFSMSYNLAHVNVPNEATTSGGQNFTAGLNFPVFQGGAVLYSLLTQRYREKAWRNAYEATVSDVFLDVYTKYTNLVLQRVLMQTLAKAVEADEEQLKVSTEQFKAGTGTRYAIMQVEALLSQDKEALLQQIVTMRQAGLALSVSLNYPLSINLIPKERTLSEAGLFDANINLRTLLQDALRYNPSLRQYENFRMATSRNIQAQAATLYPVVSFFLLYQVSDGTVQPAGNAFALGGAATSAISSFLDSSFAGRANNNALGQLYTFSPTSGSTSTQGANTGPSAVPAASGGTPIAQVQSGSLVSSGAVAPSIFGGGAGSGTGANANGSLQAPSGIFPGVFDELQAGFSLAWTLPNFGMQTLATTYAARVLARQALMQCNQELSIVAQNVRSDYLGVMSARTSIDQAAASAVATREALRYAHARLQNGVGTQLELLRAQHDYVSAVTAQAQAIVASNVAQAQLLHDMGMISASTLTTGYQPGDFAQPKPSGFSRWPKKP